MHTHMHMHTQGYYDPSQYQGYQDPSQQYYNAQQYSQVREKGLSLHKVPT